MGMFTFWNSPIANEFNLRFFTIIIKLFNCCLIFSTCLGCLPLFHFGYNGDFLEEYNKVPQAANAAVSIYKNSALFSKGGKSRLTNNPLSINSHT